MSTRYSVTVVSNATLPQPAKTGAATSSVVRYIKSLRGFMSGTRPPTSLRFAQDLTLASAVVTLSSASGTVTATINGVAFAIGGVTSDALGAAALVATVNASSNALISGVLTADNAAGVVTLTSSLGGVAGNLITVAAAGTGLSAPASGRASGGSSTNFTFSY